MDFNNKHAVITGGANGIGRCIAETFLHEGVVVTIIDIDKPAGERLQAKYKNLRFFHGDIAEKETLERFVGSLECFVGLHTKPLTHTASTTTPCCATDSFPLHVDYLINNACIGRHGLLSGCSYEDFEYVQRVGVTAPYYLTSLLLQRDLLTPGSSIVNISSTRANQSQPDTEAYSAAKGGISALTHAMAISLAGKARVNAINPGWIETANFHGDTDAAIPTTLQGQTVALSPATLCEQDSRQHPAGRVGAPEDIAEMVLFLCSEKAGFITGESITIDGGMSRLMVYHNDHGWKLE